MGISNNHLLFPSTTAMDDAAAAAAATTKTGDRWQQLQYQQLSALWLWFGSQRPASRGTHSSLLYLLAPAAAVTTNGTCCNFGRHRSVARSLPVVYLASVYETRFTATSLGSSPLLHRHPSRPLRGGNQIYCVTQLSSYSCCECHRRVVASRRRRSRRVSSLVVPISNAAGFW